MNKLGFKGLTFALAAFSFGAVSAQKTKVSSAEYSLSSGGAENVLEAKGYIDQAAANENTKDWYKMWLVRAMVYSRVVENKSNPLLSNIAGGAGYISAYSMVRFWKSPELKKADMETGIMETRNSFGVGFNEAEEVIGQKFFDSGVKYYQLLIFLHGKMDTADANDLERKGISKKYITERLAVVATYCTNPMIKMEVLTELMDQGSTSPLVYEALSKVYMEKGDTAGAERIVRRGIAAAPGDNAMFQLLINHYISINRVDLLFTDVNKQIAENPTSKLYYIRGYLHESKGDYDQAIADYEKAIELDEFNYDANYNLGVGLIKFASKPLYEKKASATGAARAEIDKQLRELFLKAKSHLELASENKNYEVADQINIYKALKTVALELGDTQGAAVYDEKIKALESVTPE